MSLAGKILDVFRRKNPIKDEVGMASALGTFSFGNYQTGLTTAEQVSLDIVETMHPVIFRCIDVISADCAQIPLVLKRYRKSGKPEVVDQHDSVGFFEDMAIKNPIEVPSTWWRLAYADLLAAGNFYAYVGKPNLTIPTDAIRINPSEIKPLPDPDYVLGGYERTIPGNGKVRTYRPEQIWHVKTWNRLDRYKGLGVLARLRDPIAIDQQMSKWRWQFFYNGVPTQILFKTSQKIPTEAHRKRLRDHLERQLLGRNNDGSQFAVIDGDTWEVVILPRPKNDEIAYAEGRKFEQQLMGMAFGIPPNKLCDFSDPTALANAVQQDTFYWEDTIMGWHSLVTDHLTYKFLRVYWPNDKDLFFEYDYRGVKALNQGAGEEAKTQSLLVTSGIRTRNEARETLGDDPSDDPLADELMIGNSKLGAGAMGLGLLGSEPAPGEANGNGNGNGNGAPDDEDDDEDKALAVLQTKGIDPRVWDLEEDERALRRLVDRQIVEMIRLAGERQLQLAGLAGAFNLEDPVVLSFIRTQLLKLREQVLTTTVAIVRIAIAEGLERGLAIQSQEFRDLIQAAFEKRREPWQLHRIARTETHSAQEGGGFLAAEQNGIERKAWITARDDRVRGAAANPHGDQDKANHEALEAIGPIPMSMSFRDPRSGAEMKYPGDTGGVGVTGADTINCRCIWVADFSHIPDDKAAEMGLRKATTSLDLDAAWHSKAKQQQDFEAILVKQLRTFFVGMQRRFLERWDALAEAERSGGATVGTR